MHSKCSIVSLSHSKDLEAALGPHCETQFVSHDQAPRRRVGRAEAIIAFSAHRIGFAIARRLAQDGAHVVISSRKQQNVNQAVATLQREGLSVTGTVCHVGKAEDREQLVSKVRCQKVEKHKEENMPILSFTAQPWLEQRPGWGPEAR